MHAHATRSDYRGLLILGAGALALGLAGRFATTWWDGTADGGAVYLDVFTALGLTAYSLSLLKPPDRARSRTARGARRFVWIAGFALVAIGVLLGVQFIRVVLTLAHDVGEAQVEVHALATMVAFLGAGVLGFRHSLRWTRSAVGDERGGAVAGADGAGAKT